MIYVFHSHEGYVQKNLCFKNEKGQSLIEGLIAIAVVAIVAAALSTSIGHFKNSTKALEGRSVCQQRADALVAPLKNADNTIDIPDWVWTNQTQIPPASQDRMTWPMVGAAKLSVPGAASFLPPITNANLVNTWQLINSGSNWALSLGNTVPAVCDIPAAGAATTFGINVANLPPLSWAPSPLAGGLKPNGPALAANEVDFLGIHIVNSQNAAPRCINANDRMIPSNINGNASQIITVTGTVTFTPQSGIPQSCSSQVQLRPESDTVRPKFVVPPTIANPFGAKCNTGLNGSGTGHLCLYQSTKAWATSTGALPTGGYPVSCLAPSVQLAASVSEKGVLLACDIEFATTIAAARAIAINPARLFVCGSNSPTPLAVTATGYTSDAPNSQSNIVVNIANLQEGFYKVFVRAFDSAQNQSAADESIIFGSDLVIPTAHPTLTPPTPLISAYGTNAPAKGHLPVTSSGGLAITAGFSPNIYQCVQGNDNWTATVFDPIPVATDGVVWSYTVNGGPPIYPLGPTTCALNLPNPIGLQSGTYIMTGTTCDTCGTNVPTVLNTSNVTWKVDLGPASVPTAPVTPVHAPTSLGAGASFLSGVSPVFTLSAAKPVTVPPYDFQYACQNVVAPTYTAQTTSCTPSLAAGTGPCTSQGAYGFCTAAFDGCGRTNNTANTPYEMQATVGQPCCSVKCAAGLICALDNSIYRGTCVPQQGCPTGAATAAQEAAADATCGAGATCYQPMGYCHGASQGPGTSACTAVIPLPTAAPTPTPTPSIPAGPSPSPCPPVAGSVTSAYQNDDSCCPPPYAVNGSTLACTARDGASPGNCWEYRSLWRKVLDAGTCDALTMPPMYCHVGLSVPANATITGIRDSYQLDADGNANPSILRSVNIMSGVGGTILATQNVNQSLPAQPGTTGTAPTSGATNNTWGGGITAAIINNPNTVMEYQYEAINNDRLIFEGHTLTVYYTVPNSPGGTCGSATSTYTTTGPNPATLCGSGSTASAVDPSANPVFRWTCTPNSCGGTPANCQTPATAHTAVGCPSYCADNVASCGGKCSTADPSNGIPRARNGYTPSGAGVGDTTCVGTETCWCQVEVGGTFCN